MFWKFNVYCSIKKKVHILFLVQKRKRNTRSFITTSKNCIYCEFLSKTFHFFFHNIVTFMLCAAKENFWFIQHTARFIMYNFHIILFFSGKQKFTYYLVYVLLLHDNSEIKHSTNSIVPILSLYGLAKKNPTYSKFVDMPSSTQ